MSDGDNKSKKRIKKILTSRFTFPILSKIHSGYRPIQIAGQLRISPQLINHYTDLLIEIDLIRKNKDKHDGLTWKLTEKGRFFLKQKLIWSVNHFNKNPSALPVRLENLSIAFKIHSPIPENERLHWTEMRNRVSKCTIDKNDHTVELVKSEKRERDGSSVILIHLSKQYCFNWTNELVRQSYLALHYAKQASTQFGIEISDYGYPVKRPHIAFEYDLIALFLAASHTADIETNQDGKTWIDSSNGFGELETDDAGYAYLYLMMPKTIEKIANTSDVILRHTNAAIRYEQCYHPFQAINN